MANTFLTPDVIARQALASLYETTVMLPLVYTDVASEFGASKIGDTVNIRKPAVFTANEFDRATGIVLQDATEGNIPVKLDRIADVSFEVTSEEMTLDIEAFDAQLLTPAMEAISQKIDRDLLSLRDDIIQSAGVAPSASDEDKLLVWSRPENLIEAGRLLNIKNVPLNERRAVVGPTTNARWLNSDVLKHADKSASTDALRNASIGRNLFGMDAYWTQNVGQPATTPATGEPTTEQGVAFHRTAFALASAPLQSPPGSNAVVMNYKGISIRIVSQYDIKYKSAIISLDTLYGVKTLDPNRAVLLQGALKA